MPGTVTPAQMFDHTLDARKGWPSPYALDKSKEIATGETGILSGMVVHIDPTTDKIKRGCPYSNSWAGMPIFAFPNQTDFDVSSDVGNISGGVLVGLVGVGAYELESTEYLSTGYNPNIPLTVENAAGDDLGKLKVTTLDSGELVVGIVSDKGPLTNEYKKTYVRFWPVYLPYRAAP
jgi:hypothetical protein